MSTQDQSDHERLLARLQRVAEAALPRFGLYPGSSVRLINLSENATYRVDDPDTGKRWALRIHRDGYHSRAAIASELAWQAALRASSAIVTPACVRGRDGEYIQTIAHPELPLPRNTVLFHWEIGREPATNDVAGFEKLGETAAHMHKHVTGWNKPFGFTRHVWNFETFLGDTPHWGRWRDGMGMTSETEAVFAKTVAFIEKRLQAYGQEPDRFGLVHGDMRLANLLMDGDQVKVIDFDDCGFSWFMYDCATTVSFFEHEPNVPELVAAWTRGYRRVAPLKADDEREIATFIMLRRLLLVAWIGSHSETELAQSMGRDYTAATVPLCEAYLASFGTQQ